MGSRILALLLAACAPADPDECDSGGCAEWCPDEDRDNYGATGADPVYATSAPAGHAPCFPSDCDDGDAEVHPNAYEACGEERDCIAPFGAC